MVGLVASTRKMWQLGQTAETMSTSSDSSVAQPEVPESGGSGLAAPFWLVTVRHPAPVPALQAGSPHEER